MEKYTGKSVLKGIAIGRIYWYQKQEYQVAQTKVQDTGAEEAVCPGCGNSPGAVIRPL